MKIKSYFANSVEDGMALARQELGPEAMLVNSRRASPETRHLGAYEVVFVTGVDGADDEPAAAAAGKPPAGDRLAQQMSELKRELEGMRRTINHQVLLPPGLRAGGREASDAYASLTAVEIAPELVREIVQAAEARISKQAGQSPKPTFETALVEELESRLKVEPALGRSEAGPRIVALVGPPGSGKTTTLVKLAVNYGLAARRPCMILSTDTYRIAAAEQLRSYSAILGVGFQLIETVTALAQAIEEHRSKDLIFIDTPGLGPTEMADHSSLAQFLASRQDIDTHLVVSSSMKSADLSRVVDTFETFHPRRLIFTKLDETGSYGAIFNEAVRTGKPLSFFSTGQRIPEDLEAVTKSRVVELIFARPAGRAISAA